MLQAFIFGFNSSISDPHKFSRSRTGGSPAVSAPYRLRIGAPLGRLEVAPSPSWLCGILVGARVSIATIQGVQGLGG